MALSHHRCAKVPVGVDTPPPFLLTSRVCYKQPEACTLTLHHRTLTDQRQARAPIAGATYRESQKATGHPKKQEEQKCKTQQ